MNTFKETFRFIVPAAAQAASAAFAALVLPFAGVVESVTYTTVSDITGANTNTRKVSVINKGQDGTGTTEVAAKQFNSGVDAADFDETTITLSATEANLEVAAGDVLAWSSAAVSSGLADPGGLVTIKVARSYE